MNCAWNTKNPRLLGKFPARLAIERRAPAEEDYFVSLVKIRGEVHRGRLYYFALYFIVLVPEFPLLCTERLRRSNITLFSVIFVISSREARCVYMPPSYLTIETSFGVVFAFLP